MSTSNRKPKPWEYNSQKNAELPAGKGAVALSLVSSNGSSWLECFRCVQGYLNEPMMKQNEAHGGLEQKLAYGQRDKIRYPKLGNFPRLWWHYTQPQQKGQNDDAHSLPDRIDGKWMCVIWRHEKQGKGTNDYPSRSYWWEANVHHFRAWVQTQWYFSIKTASFCMLLGSFRYLHTPRT